MATYKVIQDIEAEDKLLGPLTLRQFIYAAIAAVCLYLSYIALAKHAALLVILFLPVALISGFFAFPWGRDQPTEVWALAKIRFIFKPRRRIWDQSGIKELVTITAPKKIEANYSNGLSQNEVKSRLKALADTIDSRGWAVKNVNVNLSSVQPPTINNLSSSDRLIDLATLPQNVSSLDIRAADDILDEQNNPIAQHFNQMINTSEQAHRQHIVQQLQQATNPAVVQQSAIPAAAPNDYWFLNQAQPTNLAAGYATFDSSVVTPSDKGNDSAIQTNPTTTPDEQILAQELKSRQDSPEIAHSHLRTIQPFSDEKSSKISHVKPSPTVTPAPEPAILGLASNNDLNVATIARQAQQQTDEASDEVVISLHK